MKVTAPARTAGTVIATSMNALSAAPTAGTVRLSSGGRVGTAVVACSWLGAGGGGSGAAVLGVGLGVGRAGAARCGVGLAGAGGWCGVGAGGGGGGAGWVGGGGGGVGAAVARVDSADAARAGEWAAAVVAEVWAVVGESAAPAVAWGGSGRGHGRGHGRDRGGARGRDPAGDARGRWSRRWCVACEEASQPPPSGQAELHSPATKLTLQGVKSSTSRTCGELMFQIRAARGGLIGLTRPGTAGAGSCTPRSAPDRRPGRARRRV